MNSAAAFFEEEFIDNDASLAYVYEKIAMPISVMITRRLRVRRDSGVFVEVYVLC